MQATFLGCSAFVRCDFPLTLSTTARTPEEASLLAGEFASSLPSSRGGSLHLPNIKQVMQHSVVNSAPAIEAYAETLSRQSPNRWRKRSSLFSASMEPSTATPSSTAVTSTTSVAPRFSTAGPSKNHDTLKLKLITKQIPRITTPMDTYKLFLAPSSRLFWASSCVWHLQGAVLVVPSHAVLQVPSTSMCPYLQVRTLPLVNGIASRSLLKELALRTSS
mmetsp:Transcript_4377/g.10593  ORF Transcript_4377/g.10593 Transcript_4377/m.10593 type:complete len:219 (+) Transcript_4377:472-1128(+)